LFQLVETGSYLGEFSIFEAEIEAELFQLHRFSFLKKTKKHFFKVSGF